MTGPRLANAEGTPRTRGAQKMSQFHRVISKKMWFLLFNVGTTLYIILIGHLQLDAISIVSFAVALGLINLLAWISARRFPEWKSNCVIKASSLTFPSR